MIARNWRPRLPLNGHIFSYGRTDAGKCLVGDTKILMENGEFKKIKDIKIGEKVVSPTKDFKSTTIGEIKDTFSHFDKDIYEVVLNRNKRQEVLYTCNGNHQIPLHDGKLILAKNIKGRKYTMISPEIDFGHEDCLINPYLLGSWLGDGIFTERNFSFCFSKKKREILDYFNKIYPSEITSSNYNKLVHIISKKGIFGRQLNNLGLYKHSSKNKFIPKEALYSSVSFRKKLLAGLLDTDGFLKKEGKEKVFDYITKSKILAQDINFLVRSLGGYCYLRDCKKSYNGEKFFQYYRLSIYIDFSIPLKTKRMKFFNPRTRNPRKIPIIVRKVKPRKVHGISIDTESQFYIVNDFIITHNTWKLIAVIQFYHSHGYKIWDLWGGKRKEGGFWCFPSDEKKLWFDYMKRVGEMRNPGAKEYKVNLMFPAFFQEIPDELPHKKPRITSKLFTLYFKDVGLDEISTITGALSKNAQVVWKKIQKDLPDNANGEDILNWFEKGSRKKFKNLTLYNSFIVPFCESKILMGKDCHYNLDIIKESKDSDAITVLMDEYTPEEYKMFFILHFVERIYDAGEKDIISRRNIGFFRELNYFMKVQDESAQDSEQKQIMRNNFSNVARYGRSALIIAGDTQSPKEVKGLIEGQDDLMLINEMPSPGDREVVCDHLIRDGRMSTQQRDYLGSIQMGQDEEGNGDYKGKMVVVERNSVAKLITRVQPPRTKCFKVKDGNFLKVWKNLYNEYLDTTEVRDKIRNFYLLRKDKIEQEKNLITQDFEDDIDFESEDEDKDNGAIEPLDIGNKEDYKVKQTDIPHPEIKLLEDERQIENNKKVIKDEMNDKQRIIELKKQQLQDLESEPLIF